MDLVVKSLKDWAKSIEPSIDIIVCFGSYGRGDASESSDLDLAIITSHLDIIPKLLVEFINISFPNSFCYIKNGENIKLVGLIPIQKRFFRLDCFIVSNIRQVERFIVGSELSLENIENIIIYEDTNIEASRITKEYLKLLFTSNTNCEYPVDLLFDLITKFIESFEVASNKRSVGDKFQFLFQLSIAYITLVKLQYIQLGGRNFLYLPKQVFSLFPNRLRRLYEDELEPRGVLNMGHCLQKKYKAQFIDILKEFEFNSFQNFYESIGLKNISTESIEKMLQDILVRDQFYNFRPVLKCKGQLTPANLIYRSGYYDIKTLVENYNTATVIDLRTADQVIAKSIILPISTVYLHIDILALSEDITESGISYERSAVVNRSGIGLVLRMILTLPFPILFHCVAGKNRTGVIAAVIQFICGYDRAEIIRDYLNSNQGILVEDIIYFIDGIGTDVYCFLISCGLNDKEIGNLYFRLTNRIFPNFKVVSFNVIQGRPGRCCRPFHQSELKAMKYYMINHIQSIRDQKPKVIFVTGLPGSGKSTLSSKYLAESNIDIESFVNIDMDIARSFHCQYQHYKAQLTDVPNEKFNSFDDLVGWMMEGTPSLEYLLYSAKEGVVQTALEEKRNIILPLLLKSDKSIDFVNHCYHKYGYDVDLIGVHVTKKTALSRVAARVKCSGRFTPASLIENSEKDLRKYFTIAASIVRNGGGAVTLYNNDCNSIDLSSIEPVKIYSYRSGQTEINDHEIWKLYAE